MRRRYTTVLSVLLLVCLTMCSGCSGCGKKEESSYVDQNVTGINTVEIGGVTYNKKQNVKTYLIMGVDSVGPVTAVEEYDGTGQVDFLQLLVIDGTANTYETLAIDRNTVCPVGTFNSDGTPAGEEDAQISFAHAQGDGLEMSCENTVNSVESFLPDVEIDGYICLQKDTTKQINHALGGVTVTIEDDFSQMDPTLVMGETIQLTDDQAYNYCNGRMYVGDGENTSRMRRQQTYIDGAKKIALEKCRSDESFAADLFNQLSDYMVTDLTGKDISRITKAMLKDEDLGSVSFEGTSGTDELGFAEFIVDEASREKIVAELFCEKND